MTVDNVTTGTTIETDWGNDVANTVNALEADLAAATAAATPNVLVRRDAAGRAKVATPVDSSDIATKGYGDGLGVSAATPNTIMRRDAAGRAQVAAPAVAGDIATAGYVDFNGQVFEFAAGPGGLGNGGVRAARAGGYHVTLSTQDRGLNLAASPAVNSNYAPDEIITVPGIVYTNPSGTTWIMNACLVRIDTAGLITAWQPAGTAPPTPYGTQITAGFVYFSAGYDR